MQKITIEKGVPIPSSYRKKSKSRFGDTIDQMAIGDSFLYDCDDENYKRLYSAIWNAFSSRDMRCKIIRVEKNKIRVWRMSKQKKRNSRLTEWLTGDES